MGAFDRFLGGIVNSSMSLIIKAYAKTVQALIIFSDCLGVIYLEEWIRKVRNHLLK